MKRCPKCGQTYTDENINFCLNDGELLSRNSESQRSPFDSPPPRSAADDSPPTMVLDQARVTNPIGWSNTPAAPPAPWQQQQPAVYPFTGKSQPSLILPILSLVFGLCSITLGFCCYSGMLLGPAAIVMGIVALVQNKSNPELYGGRGLAIGGIATGAGYFVLFVIMIIVWGLFSFL